MIFCVDIDDTLTKWDDSRDYENFKPIQEMVDAVNELYDQGHRIELYTARGMKSVGPERIEAEIVPSLKKNLDKIGLKYHVLRTHKPVYDYFIDDKALSPMEFLKMFESQEL